MILAAADSGQHGETPGDMLQLALDCVQWNCLPRGGGYEGQRAGELKKLRMLHNVYTSFYSMMHTKLNMKQWSENNGEMWTIVAHVERMRVDDAD